MKFLKHTWSPAVRQVVALLVAALLTCQNASPAHGDTPPWPKSSYAYYAKGDSLHDVIKAFGMSFGVRTQISSAVTGQVEGRLFAETPDAFLDRLAHAYGLQWYYHGGTLFVSHSSEAQRTAIEMTPDDIPSLRDALRGLGVLEDKFGWGEFPERGVVIVSGPPTYVDLVRRTLEMLPSGRSDKMVISVFPLKHASVDDRTFTYRDRQVTVPGVATILRNIITNQSHADSGTRTEQIATIAVPSITAARGLLASGSGRLATGVGNRGESSSAANGTEQTRGKLDAPTESPVIQADTRLNAVIVKDLAERMPSYEELIQLLDVPTALIEIEAAVVDVNTNKLKDLGIDWQGQTTSIAGGFGAIEDALPSDDQISIGVGSRPNLQTILTGAGDFFLTKISALEQQGDASILSRPSVLTLDNLEAVLDLSETFYIKVEGERVADVVPVTAGVLLKVTPRLIEENGERRVKLAVDVEGWRHPGR